MQLTTTTRKRGEICMENGYIKSRFYSLVLKGFKFLNICHTKLCTAL